MFCYIMLYLIMEELRTDELEHQHTTFIHEGNVSEWARRIHSFDGFNLSTPNILILNDNIDIVIAKIFWKATYNNCSLDSIYNNINQISSSTAE